MLDQVFKERIVRILEENLEAHKQANAIMRMLVDKVSELEKKIDQLEEHAIIPGES